MSRYTVDPAQLQQVESLVLQSAGHARQTVAALRADVEALRWAGPAASSWRLAWQDWYAGVGRLLAALDELGQAVGSSGAAYAGTESAVSASMVRGAQ